jgi:hypothetical protein
VSRIRLRTDDGGAGTIVLARTAKVPPGPWVGTGIGETTQHVTGETDVTGSVAGGYIGILKLDSQSCLQGCSSMIIDAVEMKVGLGIKVQGEGLEHHS